MTDRAPLPYDFHPDVPSFDLRSDDVVDDEMMSENQVFDGFGKAIALADRIVVMGQGQIAASYPVTLSAAEREVSLAREDLRAALLADLGLANQD